MTHDEPRLAFAHPAERAEATADSIPLDRISLRDHIVSVEIGAFQAERDMTQRISFNVVVEVYRDTAELGDDVDLILSYDRVTEAIDAELAAERLNLLETLAENVAGRILAEPQAHRVFVRIEKLDRGAGKLGVEIVRSLQNAPIARTSEASAPRPRIVFLSEAAQVSEHVSHWIDQLCAQDAPLVVSVAAHAHVQAATDKAQSRINLLAAEQAAWVLAGRDARFAVVGTRTELDWAMKNGQICIWAPSKMILDTADAPRDQTNDHLAMAVWLAGEVNACELVVIGENAPESADLPVQSHTVAERELGSIARA